MSDREAIQELINRYSLAVSRRDWPGVAAVFSPDARWELAGSPIKLEGPKVGQGLKDLVESTSSTLVQMNAPATIEINGNTAKARSIMHEVADVEAENKHVELYGVYEDELVKRDGQWLFELRVFNTLNLRSTPLKV